MVAAEKSPSITATTHSKSEANTARFWNFLADFYFKQPIKDIQAYERKLEITRGYLMPHSRVLEFGCGTGGTALLHAPYVQYYHAIDCSPKMIEIATEQQRQAKEKCENSENTHDVQFECIGMDMLQAPSDSYDVVLGLCILHLLPNRKEVLDKVHSLVKPGGYFISSTICLGEASGLLQKCFVSLLSFTRMLPPENAFTKAELIESIKSAGFSIEEEYQPDNDKAKAVLLVARKI
jgi:2-polyprenyl-3-methyl-5-hydroxy-6-metoxy-1,4-benzoquinol methylase